ncbi:type III PLP-dependent enzyme [Plantactinospora endophytica]|uniref:Diaminopimelate decarboxylase n=1 Tax=Plantactinospora endophytica TaxID=673535 RepID=A0ABQ4DVF0_9ACTN|nr:type III PLP-dependent enzyme [Plantactinospora endophytica]GIG86026.1 diaminopimelate decarboxylase [Plantactinospora endophytica]
MNPSSPDRPSYWYDLAGLADSTEAIRAALPSGVELLYAMKANPDPGILRTLAPHVDGFEVASGGELRHLAEVFPETPAAAFGGPGKTDAELAAGLAAGVRRFHVESPTELLRLDRLAAARGTVAEVLLRVNLPLPVGEAVLVMGGRPSPFGMDPQDARDCARLDLPGIRIRGVHAHLGSGLAAPGAASVARTVVEWAVAELDAGEVNVGGGMAVDYADPTARFDWPAYGAALGELLARYPGRTLRVEPGRALTVYCGRYRAEVLDVKRSGGEWFVVVAGGTHQFRTPAAKGHSQPFTVLPRERWPYPFARPVTGAGPVTVVGQLCTPKDVLARVPDAAGLPPPGRIAAGDTIVFELAGAYAWNISHRDFLMHDPPEFRTGVPEHRPRNL